MRGKRISCVSLVVLLLLISVLGTACGNQGQATTMKLARMDGSVGVWNEKLKELEPVENMGLYSGYQMDTEEESFAWIDLDSAKLAKMDQKSDIEILKSGKDLEILVNVGKVYFNVSEPLEEDESMNIRTSTMGVEVRETCGWVEVPDKRHMVVYILEGVAECSVADAGGEKGRTESVSAGQTAVMSLKEGEEAITVKQFAESDIPSFVMGELSTGELEAFRQNLTRPAGTLAGGRPMLMNASMPIEDNVEQPTVETYAAAADLSNVDNLWQYPMGDEMAAKLAANNFVVTEGGGREFFEVYETNRYKERASFVTVDSLMHTYHLYFSYLLKNVERSQLINSLTQLSRRMLDNCAAQYDQLSGSEWEEAAKRNVAFFAVGAKLLDDSTQIPAYAEEMARHELDCIGRAGGIETSLITGADGDYSQYIPRGYYEGDARLEQYFRAMMWYGRIHFKQKEEELDRSALLITKALSEDMESYGLWEAIYAVTSFFAGASDDLGVCEYGTVMAEIYGEEFAVSDLIGNTEAFVRFHTRTGSLSAPRINSLPIRDGEDNTILGFRFMGQRFSIDAAIMQKLIYSAVDMNSAGEHRMLPDVLDVPAAMGSDIALRILTENGAADYAGYSENMNWLRGGLSIKNDTLWSASLYASWLNTLRPLLTPKGEGYPIFMQSEEWLKKDLECFAGSFAELKHDTILYSKQVMAEMGGEYNEQTPDDRGYVEPEPLVYARFVNLASQTAEGLRGYGMLDPVDEENLSRLTEIAGRLQTISEKELREELLTDEEFEFIKTYGGNLEHFWREALRDENNGERLRVEEYPAAIVADIATDPNGQVLEVATGNPATIYVLIKVDGKVKIASGSVYSFYQFAWPLNDRLTDSRWREMMGLQVDESGYYNYDERVEKPEWTRSYRYSYEWE